MSITPPSKNRLLPLTERNLMKQNQLSNSTHAKISTAKKVYVAVSSGKGKSPSGAMLVNNSLKKSSSSSIKPTKLQKATGKPYSSAGSKSNSKPKSKSNAKSTSPKSNSITSPKTKTSTKSSSTSKAKSKSKPKSKTKSKTKSKSKPKPKPVVELTEEERKKQLRRKRSWEGNSDDEGGCCVCVGVCVCVHCPLVPVSLLCSIYTYMHVGSVDSGVLEENICWACGCSTEQLPPELWRDIIVCDRCDAEYHKTCVGFDPMDMLPRRGWTCGKCRAEVQAFAALDFSFPECSHILQVRKGGGVGVVYLYICATD